MLNKCCLNGPLPSGRICTCMSALEVTGVWQKSLTSDIHHIVHTYANPIVVSVSSAQEELTPCYTNLSGATVCWGSGHYGSNYAPLTLAHWKLAPPPSKSVHWNFAPPRHLKFYLHVGSCRYQIIHQLYLSNKSIYSRSSALMYDNDKIYLGYWHVAF